jgi:hypothetical protein
VSSEPFDTTTPSTPIDVNQVLTGAEGSQPQRMDRHSSEPAVSKAETLSSREMMSAYQLNTDTPSQPLQKEPLKLKAGKKRPPSVITVLTLSLSLSLHLKLIFRMMN